VTCEYTPVPEPTTAGLAALGLVAMVFARRSRRERERAAGVVTAAALS